MKVLFLNPHLHADHKLVTDLQAKGFAVLLPANAEEAGQMVSLHGSSIDLAVIHREDQGSDNNERGFEFLAKLKAAHSDVPVLVTSHRWGDAEFADHQDSPLGANAYLKWPFTLSTLTSTIDAIYGRSAPSAAEASASQGIFIPTADMVLEDVSGLFSGGASSPGSNSSIQLEAPEVEVEAAPSLMQTAPSAPEAPVSGSGGEIELSSFELPESESPEPAESPVALPEPPSVEELSIQMGSEPVAPALEVAAPEDDAQAAQEMPYIFGTEGARSVDPSLIFAQPQGDAVVPGGAAHSPDTETLKRYLLLREQDVAALSSQLKSACEQIQSLEEQLRDERAKNTELSHSVAEQERRLQEFEKEKQAALESASAETEDLRFLLKTKSDKARILESQVREATDEMGRLKERVRTDIRKIRVREKELENRLELMRKDTDALLASRESKIIELKRKLDLMEFNMDLLQDQHSREKENSNKLRERLTKAAQVVRVAGGLLDAPGGVAQLAAALEEEAG